MGGGYVWSIPLCPGSLACGQRGMCYGPLLQAAGTLRPVGVLPGPRGLCRPRGVVPYGLGPERVSSAGGLGKGRSGRCGRGGCPRSGLSARESPSRLRMGAEWCRPMCARRARVPRGHARSLRGVGAMRLQRGLGGGDGRAERTEWAAAKRAEGVGRFCSVRADCHGAAPLRIERGGVCNGKGAERRDTPGRGAALRRGVARRGRGAKAKGGAARGCSAWRSGRTAWGCGGPQHAVPSGWCAMWVQAGALRGAVCVGRGGGRYGHASLI